MADYRKLAREAARAEGIDPGLFSALVNAESGFNASARSPAGARGLTQLMPATARSLGVNPDDPADNLRGGARYLKQQLDRFGGDRHKALAAYNAGPGAVEKYGGVPPFAETQAYVRRIMGQVGTASTARERATAGSPGTPGTVGKVTPGTPPSYQAGQVQQDDEGALVDSLLERARSGGKGSLLADHARRIATGAYTTTTPGEWQDGKAAKYTPGSPATAGTPAAAIAGPGTVNRLVEAANTIDAKRLPYKWGGGHGGRVTPSTAEPLDCSGAVSAVLGIDPRVSGQFKSWGKPGEGGRTTVYANDTHVLMKIRREDGKWHFFGTSKSNPGGGAGWIPAAQITKAYLAKFTARHA